MFERYFAKKRLMKIAIGCKVIADSIKKDARAKLSLYKALTKEVTERDIDASLSIIKEQARIMTVIKTNLIDSDFGQYRDNKSRANRIIIDSFESGMKLSNRLSQVFHSQSAFLKEKNILKYREYFKDELKIYKEYESLTASIPHDILNQVRDEYGAVMHPHSPVKYIGSIITCIVILSLWSSFTEKDISESVFKDFTSLFITIGLWTAIEGAYIEIRRYIARIKAKI